MAHAKPHLVLAGGGHAHLTTITNIHRLTDQGIRVTVVSPDDHHFYSGMGPGLLGGRYRPEQLRFDTGRMVVSRGGVFIRDRVIRIDPISRILHLASAKTLSYDVASFNLGSAVPDDMTHPSAADVYPVKPIASLIHARDRIEHLARQGTPTIAVAGGGPSAVEVAGNAHQCLRNLGVTDPKVTVYAGGRLLDRFPEATRQAVSTNLNRRGIAVRELNPVASVSTGRIMLVSGQTVAADVIFLATGVVPPSVFARSDLPTGPDGGLLVNRFLQCPDHPELFAGGDCAFFSPRPLAKVGVYAVRQNPVLLGNITAGLTGGKLTPFRPGGGYLLIFNLGDGTGLFRKGRIQFGGRLAMRIKDTIDLKFMHRFQDQPHPALAEPPTPG